MSNDVNSFIRHHKKYHKSCDVGIIPIILSLLDIAVAMKNRLLLEIPDQQF